MVLGIMQLWRPQSIPQLQESTIDHWLKTIESINTEQISRRDIVNVWSIMGNDFLKKLVEESETWKVKYFISFSSNFLYVPQNKMCMIRIKKQNIIYDWRYVLNA